MLAEFKTHHVNKTNKGTKLIWLTISDQISKQVTSLHFSTNICTFYSLHLQNRLVSLVLTHLIIDYFYLLTKQDRKMETDSWWRQRPTTPEQILRSETFTTRGRIYASCLKLFAPTNNTFYFYALRTFQSFWTFWLLLVWRSWINTSIFQPESFFTQVSVLLLEDRVCACFCHLW